MNKWQDQVAVITGAASGIGRGLAEFAATRGMHVVAVDVDRLGLQRLEDSLEEQSLSIMTFEIDVSDAVELDKLADNCFCQFNKVNLLFNNAGVLVDGKSWERSVKDWQWSIDVNIMGVVNGIRSFVPRMLKQGETGRVINTSSIGGLLAGGAFMGPYQMSKHAVTALTETLYNELALEDAAISASILCPGDVASGIFDSDRLRSAEDHNILQSEFEQDFHNLLAKQTSQGLQPDEFASKVFGQIEADKFWILPQPSFKPLYQLRTNSIMNETAPPSFADMATVSTR